MAAAASLKTRFTTNCCWPCGFHFGWLGFAVRGAAALRGAGLLALRAADFFAAVFFTFFAALAIELPSGKSRISGTSGSRGQARLCPALFRQAETLGSNPSRQVRTPPASLNSSEFRWVYDHELQPWRTVRRFGTMRSLSGADCAIASSPGGELSSKGAPPSSCGVPADGFLPGGTAGERLHFIGRRAKGVSAAGAPALRWPWRLTRAFTRSVLREAHAPH